MKKYLIQKGDSLSSVAERFSVKDAQTLRSFHKRIALWKTYWAMNWFR